MPAHTSINEEYHYERLFERESERWHLLAECCRLQRNLVTAIGCYSALLEAIRCKLDLDECKKYCYEYPTEKK